MDHSQHSIHEHGTHSHDHMMHSGGTTVIPPLGVLTVDEGVNLHDHSLHNEIEMKHMNGHDHGSIMMQHVMAMSFHFGCNETVLFDWWQIDSNMGLVISAIVIFVMAVAYEGLKYYREYLFWKTYNLLEYRPVSGPQRNPEDPQQPTTLAGATSPVQYVGEVIHKQPPKMLSLHHLYQTLLHILQVTLSFLLMLIFMTYNIWLCMAVVIGAAVGYFLFCWKKSVIVDVTEHCH